MNKPFTKDATWAINRDAIKKLPDKQIILFACDVARIVVPIWEQHCPDDNCPRTAIETAELFVYGQATIDQLEKARLSARILAVFTERNAVYAAWYASYYAINTVNDAACATYVIYHAKKANPQILPTIQTIYQQTTPIAIPTTPILKAIANQIVQTRNFHEYNILLDNLEECHNIRLERTIPLGLSHYVLYHLTNTH